MEQLPFRHFELDAQLSLLCAAPHTKERGSGLAKSQLPLGLQKRQGRVSWLCRTGIDAKHFPFIGSVLTDLATASLDRWCPCADVNGVIVLRASHTNKRECQQGKQSGYDNSHVYVCHFIILAL